VTARHCQACCRQSDWTVEDKQKSSHSANLNVDMKLSRFFCLQPLQSERTPSLRSSTVNHVHSCLLMRRSAIYSSTFPTMACMHIGRGEGTAVKEDELIPSQALRRRNERTARRAPEDEQSASEPASRMEPAIKSTESTMVRYTACPAIARKYTSTQITCVDHWLPQNFLRLGDGMSRKRFSILHPGWMSSWMLRISLIDK
jgi:hypothetical protein